MKVILIETLQKQLVGAEQLLITSSKVTKKKIGRPKKLSERDKRSILRVASNAALSYNQIKSKSGVNCSRSTVRRIIKSSKNIVRRKFKKIPPLTKKHKDNRLTFAREYMAWTNEWKKVVFTDEKKFNLDGPDGYKYYFHDLRKEERFLSHRQSGGGSIMLWGSISYNGALSLIKISGHQNAIKYFELLDQELGVMNDKLGDGSWIFQQDNAPIHTAKIVKEWFTNKNVTVLQWLAKSPDLNIIENVWGHLSRVLYENGKQYDSLNELENAIFRHWATIPKTYIEKLYDSIPSRIFEVINKSGGFTNKETFSTVSSRFFSNPA